MPRKSILIYTKAGRYERSIEILGSLRRASAAGRVRIDLFYPDQVVVSPTGDLFVRGWGSRQVDKKLERANTDMIIKLSPSGEVLTSFSPFPAAPHMAGDRVRRMSKNFLLLDNAGHLIHVLPDATMRVFDLDGRWLKTLSPTLPVGDDLYSVVGYDSQFVFTTAGRQQGVYQIVVSAEGDVLSWTEISGKTAIKIQGKDGSYYAISGRRRARSEPPEIQVSKIRLDLSQ